MMNDTPITILDHVCQFLNGVGATEFRLETKAARYAWISAMLFQSNDPQFHKTEKRLR